MSLFAEVVFPLPLSRGFWYAVPAELEKDARVGVRVFAPLGQKRQAGFIAGLSDCRPDADIALREILKVLDPCPVVSPAILRFTQRLSEYYLSSWGEFLQASLPPSLEIKASAKIALTDSGREALAAGTLSGEERRLADIIGAGAYTTLYLRKKSGSKNVSSVLTRLQKKGLIEALEREKAPRKKRLKADERRREMQLELDFTVSEAVRSALAPIGPALRGDRFASFYLFGNPRERRSVYFSAIHEALSESKQVLFLVPEIAHLTPLRDALEKRFGDRAAFIYGELSGAAREREWQKIKSRKAGVAVGPRSVLFSPVENVGLIIVDDEHDDSYVQEESPAYDARRAARLRAAEDRAVLIYGSEVPTVGAFYRAEEGGTLIRLPREQGRCGVDIVDEKTERSLIGRGLREGLGKSLRAGRPSLVFLNRRGYASFLFCPRCGFIPECESCHISLAYYKNEEKLVCRYCGGSIPRARACPKCGNRVLEPRGIGIEAVEEELQKLFPGARIACFDSDRVKTKAAREAILERFRDGKIDILLGTQMLAHRPEVAPVSFVGVLNPEAQLAFSDFQASAKTFQALHRMTRFVGANDSTARIVIQTSFPEHYSIREAALGNYEAFYDQEIGFRRIMNYPPFSAMAEIVLFGREMRSLGRKARDLARRARTPGREIEVIGPAVSPPASRRGEKGIRIILKSETNNALDAFLREDVALLGIWKSVVRYDYSA